MHHILVATLVEDRRRSCPRGTVFDRPDQLCCMCCVGMTWRYGQSQRSRNIGQRLSDGLVGAWSWIPALATLVLRAVSKRAT